MFKNEKVREVLAQAARNVWGTAATLATIGGVFVLLAAVAYYEARSGQHVGFLLWLLLAAGTWVALLLFSAAGLWWIRHKYIRYNNTGKRVVYIEDRRSDGQLLASTMVGRRGFYWCQDPQARLSAVSLPDNNRIDTREQTGIADIEVAGRSVLATVHYSLIAELDGGFSPRALLKLGHPGVDAWFSAEFRTATAGVGTELAEAVGENRDPHRIAEIVRGRIQEHGPFQPANLPQNIKRLTVRTRLDLPGSSTWLTK